MSVAVIGSGAFGTALAISLSKKYPKICLWGHNANHISKMQQRRENYRKLANIPFPNNLILTCDFSCLLTFKTLLLAVPMQTLRELAVSRADALAGKTLVACCKGLEQGSNMGPLAILDAVLPNNPKALLTGPSFAQDIARGLPTALTLACADAALAGKLQCQLTTTNLRLYRTTDTVGAELGGGLKNVIAIACGAATGAGLGASARAALMTRGYAEMQRMALPLGARPETLAGLSGFGDLALTCSTQVSRNFRFGLSLGQGVSFDPTVTIEGVATAKAALDRAKKMQIDMPITAAVVALLEGDINMPQALNQLLSRPLKEE